MANESVEKPLCVFSLRSYVNSEEFFEKIYCRIYEKVQFIAYFLIISGSWKWPEVFLQAQR